MLNRLISGHIFLKHYIHNDNNNNIISNNSKRRTVSIQPATNIDDIQNNINNTQSVYRYINCSTDIRWLYSSDLKNPKLPVESIDTSRLSHIIQESNKLYIHTSNGIVWCLSTLNQSDCDLWYITFQWLIDILKTKTYKFFEPHAKHRHLTMNSILDILCDHIDVSNIDNQNININDINNKYIDILYTGNHIDKIQISIELQNNIKNFEHEIRNEEESNRLLLVSSCKQMIDLQYKIDELRYENQQLQETQQKLKESKNQHNIPQEVDMSY